MSPSIRPIVALIAFSMLPATLSADEPVMPRSELLKRAKAATALLQYQGGTASAFCAHPSGLFVTNQHAVESARTGQPPNLVLDAGLKSQRVLKAEVVRVDKVLDLALLRVEAQPSPLPSLALGSDEELDELKELIAFGFPFGVAMANKPGQYPAISVNLGSVTSLRRDEKGELNRIQLDAELNPGNSGGPILDLSGKVVGVTVSGIRGSGINLAIPVSHVKRFLARPDIRFAPPVVDPSKAQQPVEFRAEVFSIVPTTSPYDLELAIGPAGKATTLPMELADGAYTARAVAFPPRSGPLEFHVNVKYAEGIISGTTADRDVKLDSEAVKLSQVRNILLNEKANATLRDGRKVQGKLVGLDSLPIRLGPQTFDVKIAGAKEVVCQSPDPTNVVSCTVVARQAGKVLESLSCPVYLEGAEREALDAIREGRFSRPLRGESPISYLHAYSDTGDYIGQGKTYLLRGDEMTSARNQRGFSISAAGFTFLFGGPGNAFLEAREYLDAKRHPFSNEAPGIEISGNGRGCNTVDGKFAVWEYATKGNEVVRLAIDFTHRCESKVPFYGKIRINSNFH